MNHLVELAANGDRTAEQELFQHLHERFFVIAKQRVGDHEAARDLAQAACLTVFEKFRTETYTVGFQAWAYGVLRMKIGNYFQSREVRRRRISETPLSDASPDLAYNPPDPLLERRLNECLEKILKVNSRYATALRMVGRGYRTQEICGKLSITTGSLYAALHRGRAMLRSCLENGEVSAHG